MSEFTENVSYAIAFAAALLAVHLGRNAPIARAPAGLLALSFALISVQALLVGLVGSSRHTGPDFLRALIPTLALLFAPAFLIFFRAARAPGKPISPLNLLHALPAIAALVQIMTWHVLIDIDLMIVTSFATYSIWLFILVRRGASQFDELRSGASHAYFWLVACTIWLAYAAVAEAIVYAGIRLGIPPRESLVLPIGAGIRLLLIGGITYAALQRAPAFSWLWVNHASEAGQPPATDPTPEQTGLVRRADTLLETEPEHLETIVSLKQLADKLGTTPRQLSNAINCVSGENFSRYMNVKRVEHAKRLMQSQPDAPITAIMFDAGFRTKSSFNREFRAITGQSPSEFRALLAHQNSVA